MAWAEGYVINAALHVHNACAIHHFVPRKTFAGAGFCGVVWIVALECLRDRLRRAGAGIGAHPPNIEALVLRIGAIAVLAGTVVSARPSNAMVSAPNRSPCTAKSAAASLDLPNITRLM